MKGYSEVPNIIVSRRVCTLPGPRYRTVPRRMLDVRILWRKACGAATRGPASRPRGPAVPVRALRRHPYASPLLSPPEAFPARTTLGDCERSVSDHIPGSPDHYQPHTILLRPLALGQRGGVAFLRGGGVDHNVVGLGQTPAIAGRWGRAQS